MAFSSGHSLGVATIIGLFVAYIYRRSHKIHLPPGPKRLPLLGNAHQLPTTRPWLGLAQMSKIHGDLMHLDIFGQPMLVVNSRKVVADLLEKRSSNFSDRPIIPMIDMTGRREVFSLSTYGDPWRRQRRMVAQDFGSTYASNHYSLQEQECRLLVKNTLANPENIVNEIKLRTGAIIIRATYGYYVHSLDDPMIAVPLKGMEDFNRAAQPGEFPVNLIPSLRYLPRWFPGTGFFKFADTMDDLYRHFYEDPYNWCRKNLETGKTLLPNLCNNIWEKNPGELASYEHRQMALAASAVLGGGLHSGMSSALTFFMNMILHPEVQRKAQAELDAVIGTERLPNISDRPNLPYIRSILAETLRSMPPLPLCLPHAVKNDDVYDGYRLPKGAWIIPNIWQMTHDPEEYPDPMAFKPERYEGDDRAMERAKDPVFGFGRRVCPGRLFAENSLFAIISTTLATCDVLPGLDEYGREVLPSGQYTSGTIIFPEVFNLRLKPRSSRGAALLGEVKEVIQ